MDTIQFHTCPLPLLWHEFDNSLWYFLQSNVSFCLHMYFLWRHPLPPNKWGNYQDIVTLIDSHIVLTYDCWHMTVDILPYLTYWWLLHLSLQYFSESCFGNDNKFLSPNPWVVFFFISSTFYSKFCSPNPFLFGATPHHK
jgi:hypothetical protein